MRGRQPLVALCLLLMKMQWQSLQRSQCLSACSSQQQFLRRMSSCTAQSCCLESWSHGCCKFHVWRWVWDSISGLECSYGSEHLDPMIKCWHLRQNQLLLFLPSVCADPTVLLLGGQRLSAVIHVFSVFLKIHLGDRQCVHRIKLGHNFCFRSYVLTKTVATWVELTYHKKCSPNTLKLGLAEVSMLDTTLSIIHIGE